MHVTDQNKKPRKITIDIELTNACNARCSFCPRDNMPEIGIINPDIFYKAVDRGLEYPVKPVYSFCGTGDALMNKHIVKYAQYVVQSGCELRISTNGYLMTEAKARALIDAGVSRVTFSISSRGDKYRSEYGLDYETTHKNILNFIELAEGKCDVRVAMVLHDESIPYDEDEAYWRSAGISSFKKYKLINRAGALFPPKELTENEVSAAKLALEWKGKFSECMAPFLLLFIGWDGHYYLCSSDWRKNAPVGHVNAHSIEETMPARRCAVKARSPICSQCTADPINRLLAEPIEQRNLIVRQIA